MAISLNSLNSTVSSYGTRITNLENKIGSGGGIIESKLANPGYVKFANGLIMNWGSTSYGFSGNITFPKSYTSKVVVTTGYVYTTYASDYYAVINNITLTGFRFPAGFSGTANHWFAIGY